MSEIEEKVESRMKFKKTGEQKGKKRPPSIKDQKFKSHTDIRASLSQWTLPVSISKGTQIAIGCEIGIHITPKNPWSTVTKQAILHDIEINGKDSEFSSIRSRVSNYPENEMMIGYNPSSEEENVFLLCVFPEGVEYIRANIQAKIDERQAFIQRAINKPIRDWISLGSEKEVDDTLMIDARPLIVVQAETESVNIKQDIEFSAVDTKDFPIPAKASFPSFGENKLETIAKRRGESGTQAVPTLSNKKTQTNVCNCKHTSSQYEPSEVVYAKTITNTGLAQVISTMMDNSQSYLEYQLNYNVSFDLYKDDYSELCHNPLDKIRYEQDVITELDAYVDVEHCKGRTISSISWNQRIPSMVAVAYALHNRWKMRPPEPSDQEKKNQKGNADVFLKHYVLIWNINNPYVPQLYLECPHEAHCLSFSPYNDTLLVGGLLNGQVVVWDVTSQFAKISDTNKADQSKFRRGLMQYIKWIHLKKENVVDPAVVSSSEFSHLACVSNIIWTNRLVEICSDGSLQPTSDENKVMQFITVSEDGNINVWNLLARPETSFGLFKPKKLGQARKRPEKLLRQSSELRCLYRVMRPTIQLSVHGNADAKIPMFCILSEPTDCRFIESKITSRSPYLLQLDFQVATLGIDLPPENYNILDPKFIIQNTDVLDSIKFDLELFPLTKKPVPFLMSGSYTGTVFKLTWEPFDTSVKQAVVSQKCIITTQTHIHDGPILQIAGNPFIPEFICCMGGRVISFWHDDYPDVPIRWIRGSCQLVDVTWSRVRPSTFLVSRIDGKIEYWNLEVSVSYPEFVKETSVDGLSGLWRHHYMSKMGFALAADNRGTLKLYYRPPPVLKRNLENIIANFKNLMNIEITRKHAMSRITERWLNTHVGNSLRGIFEKRRMSKKKSDIQFSDEYILNETGDDRDEKLARKVNTHVTITELMEAQSQKNKKRMVNEVLKRKGLDKKKLADIQQDIELQREQEKQKRQKQRVRLEEKEEEMSKTLDKLFSDKVQLERPSRKSYSVEGSLIMNSQIFPDYKSMEKELEEYLFENPFSIKFDWNSCLLEMEKKHQEVLECRNIKDIRNSRPPAQVKKIPLTAVTRRSTDDISSLENEEQFEEEEEEEPLNWDEMYQDDFIDEEDPAEGGEELEYLDEGFDEEEL